MRASFNPGVSIRLKFIISQQEGFVVTDMGDRPALKTPSCPANRLRKVDLPWPMDPITITVGFYGFASPPGFDCAIVSRVLKV